LLADFQCLAERWMLDAVAALLDVFIKVCNHAIVANMPTVFVECLAGFH
jgi:hypothetical protein